MRNETDAPAAFVMVSVRVDDHAAESERHEGFWPALARAADRPERRVAASAAHLAARPDAEPRPPASPSTTRTGRSAPPSQRSRRSASPPTSTHAIPPAPAPSDGSATPWSRAMKNGSGGSRIASATPVSRAVRPLRRDHRHLGVEPPRDRRDVVDHDRPREQAVPVLGDPPLDGRAERRARRLVPVEHREQLEVAAAERDDQIVGADPVVAPAGDGAATPISASARAAAASRSAVA